MEKNSLELRSALTQSLAMTPQLQQAIKLLQLSRLELNAEIQNICEHNPLLEIEESSHHLNEESLENIIEQAYSEDVNSDPFDNDSSVKNNDIEGQDALSLFDANGDHPLLHTIVPPQSSQQSFDQEEIYEGATIEDLHSHLLWQLELSPLKSMDRDIALSLIDGIDDSGYLIESEEDILNSLKETYPEITQDQISPILKLIQHYEPLGVGARSLAECLLIQLENLPNSPKVTLASSFIKDDLKALSNRDYRALMKKYNLNEESLKQVLNLIKSLNPRPGNIAVKHQAAFVIPDVLVIRDKNGNYDVELNSAATYKVKINENYKGLINKARDERDRQFFKNNLQEANWFIQSLNKRHETLLKVARCIVKHQRAFMDKGALLMQPLILNDIATEIDMHESTISRITTAKYLHTPRGTFELKYFFSSSLTTDEGKAASSTAIRAAIKDMIAAENPRKPLSDNVIAAKLKAQGFIVARRTIAKYREALGIAPSSQRKQLI